MFLEMELAATYAPQNIYCYAIDKKSSELFHQRIHALAECFPNIFYIKTEYNITSAGENMGFAHYECLKELIKFDWKYVVLLQVIFVYDKLYKNTSHENKHRYAILPLELHCSVAKWLIIGKFQNHDFAMKTNAEMVQIFTWMNGTNDVEVVAPIWSRVDRNQNWSFEALNLFQQSLDLI